MSIKEKLLQKLDAELKTISNNKSINQYRIVEMFRNVIHDTPILNALLPVLLRKNQILIEMLQYLWCRKNTFSVKPNEIEEIAHWYLQKEEHNILSEQLYYKLKAEHDKWLDGLRKSTKDKIIQKADLIILFESVVDLICNFPEFLDSDSLRALLSLDNALDEIKRAWYNWDKKYYSELEGTISYLALELTAPENKEAAA